MARRPRIHLPSLIYHVMLKGNDGQSIFFSDADRCKMCFLLQEGVQRFGHKIHAFCFMKNHVHFAIQVNEISISRIIQNLAFRYTRYINRKYGRIGHLFQGRFKSIIVQGSLYFNRLIKYIHLNPNRAYLVAQPENYQWSSHRSYLGLDKCLWVTKNDILQKFGKIDSESLKNFEDFVLSGIEIEPEYDFKKGISDGILGDVDFIESFANHTNDMPEELSLPELVSKLSDFFNVSESILKGPRKGQPEAHARKILAFLVRESDHIALEDLGKYLNRHPSGLSRLAGKFEIEVVNSESANDQLEAVRDALYC